MPAESEVLVSKNGVPAEVGPSSDAPLTVRGPARNATQQYALHVWAHRWMYCTIGLLGLLLVFQFSRHEKFFPFWDTANFFDRARLTADLSASPLRALKYVARSMGEDYNSAFSILVLPFFKLFGDDRTVFLAALFVLFFFPLSLLTGALAHLASPTRKQRSAVVATVALLCVPICWYATLRGYPDCGGAIFGIAAVYVYLTSERLLRRREACWFGILLGSGVLFRRHFVYNCAAIVIAAVADLAVCHCVDRRYDWPATRSRLVNLGMALLISAGVVTLLAPRLAWRSVLSARGGYPKAYVAYQLPWSQSALEILYNCGPILVLLSCLGFILYSRENPRNPVIRFILYFAGAWLVLWLVFVRQESSHYPHAQPVFIAVGVACLWHSLASLRKRARAVGLATLVAVLGLHLTYVLSPAWPSSWIAGHVHNRLLPRDAWPLVAPNYHEIVQLVSFLREQAQESVVPIKVVVAASSINLNPDIVEHAEIALHKDRRIQVLPTPQVDERDGVPTEHFLGCNYFVVAQPFQHHLPAAHQKSVSVLLEAFSKHWPIAEDFTLLPASFGLGSNVPGGRIYIYRRIRPSSPEVARDTESRITRYLLGTNNQ